MFAATVAELFLLHPAAGLLHRGEPELDQMECIEHRGGVFEFVPDGVEPPPTPGWGQAMER